MVEGTGAARMVGEVASGGDTFSTEQEGEKDGDRCLLLCRFGEEQENEEDASTCTCSN